MCLATLTNVYRVKTQCARMKSSGLGRRGWRGKARLKLKQDTLPKTNDGPLAESAEINESEKSLMSTKTENLYEEQLN